MRVGVGHTEQRCERHLNHLGRDHLCYRWLIVSVIVHHLCSTLVISVGHRWPPLLLSQTIYLLCPNVNHHMLPPSQLASCD